MNFLTRLKLKTTNPQFILNLLPKRVKSQYFFNCASGKVI